MTLMRFFLTAILLSECTNPSETPDTLYVPSQFETIQDAIDAAPDGATIFVAPGVYQGKITIDGKAVVLEAEAVAYSDDLPDRSLVGQTVIDAGGADHAIKIESNGGDVTIRGFTIRNADDGIYPKRPFTLTHTRITGTSDGIDYEGGGGLVEYCYFDNNSDDGIDLDQKVAVTIRSSEIVDNEDDGIEIRLHPFEGDSVSTTIAYNTIARNGEDGIQFIDYEVPTARRFLIERNLILDNAMAGIGLMGEENTDESYEGDSVDERIEIVNNTFAGNSYGISGGGNLLIANNVVMRSTELGIKNATLPARVSHVLFFENGLDTENTDLEEANVLRSDPMLGEDYDVLAGSPVIDAGTTHVGAHRILSDDSFEGAAPDLGAREYSETAQN